MKILVVDVDATLAIIYINLKANLLEFFNVQSSYSRGNIFWFKFLEQFSALKQALLRTEIFMEVTVSYVVFFQI